jgi:hypothetical protein
MLSLKIPSHKIQQISHVMMVQNNALEVTPYERLYHHNYFRSHERYLVVVKSNTIEHAEGELMKEANSPS